MRTDELIAVLSTEQTCVMRQAEPGCDRNCAVCDLVLPDKTVLTAYQTTLDLLRAKQKAENEPLTLKELRRMDGQVAYCPEIKKWGLILVDSAGRWKNRPFFMFVKSSVWFEWNVVARHLTIYRCEPAQKEAVDL